MKFKLVGDKTGDFVIIIGTWDPLIYWDILLLKRLIRYSKKNALNPCLILLHPNPSEILNKTKQLTYDCLQNRIDFIRSIGINCIMLVQMTEKDLDKSANVFLGKVCSKIYVKEIWLGAKQSLGRSNAGSKAAVKFFCEKRWIKLKIFKHSIKKLEQFHYFKNLISKGNYPGLLALMKRRPFWYKSPGKIFVGWPKGMYEVDCTLKSNIRSNEFIEVKNNSNNETYFYWPRNKEVFQIEFLKRLRY